MPSSLYALCTMLMSNVRFYNSADSIYEKNTANRVTICHLLAIQFLLTAFFRRDAVNPMRMNLWLARLRLWLPSVMITVIIKRGRGLFALVVEMTVVELLRPLQLLAFGYTPCKSSLFLVRMRHVE